MYHRDLIDKNIAPEPPAIPIIEHRQPNKEPPSELAREIITAIRADRRAYPTYAAMDEAHARIVDRVMQQHGAK